MNIYNNQVVYDNFEVLDEDNNPVSGLVSGNFTTKLYDPDKNEVSSSITISFEELGNGLYRISFTPNKLGNWILTVYNSTYFPYGKGENYTCIDDRLARLLGLTQENFRIFNPTYVNRNTIQCMTSATIKIYPTAIDCENDTNEIAEYGITATYNENALMTSYKMVKN